jgi:hypothetical protein
LFSLRQKHLQSKPAVKGWKVKNWGGSNHPCPLPPLKALGPLSNQVISCAASSSKRHAWLEHNEHLTGARPTGGRVWQDDF